MEILFQCDFNDSYERKVYTKNEWPYMNIIFFFMLLTVQICIWKKSAASKNLPFYMIG